jgi:hypothetical protein
MGLRIDEQCPICGEQLYWEPDLQGTSFEFCCGALWIENSGEAPYLKGIKNKRFFRANCVLYNKLDTPFSLLPNPKGPAVS